MVCSAVVSIVGAEARPTKLQHTGFEIQSLFVVAVDMEYSRILQNCIREETNVQCDLSMGQLEMEHLRALHSFK